MSGGKNKTKNKQTKKKLKTVSLGTKLGTGTDKLVSSIVGIRLRKQQLINNSKTRYFVMI